jgi:hypothetical protein
MDFDFGKVIPRIDSFLTSIAARIAPDLAAEEG